MANSLLQQEGFYVRSHRPCEVNTGRTAYLGQTIKEGGIQVLWTNIPSKLHLKEGKYPSHMSCLARWARACLAQKIPFIMFGPAGRMWTEPECQGMLDDLSMPKVTHRLCHWGLSLTPASGEDSTSSSARMITVSNLSIPSHQCRCGPNTKHIMDWSSRDPHITRPSQSKEKIMKQVAAHIIEKIRHLLSTGVGQTLAPDKVSSPSDKEITKVSNKANHQVRHESIHMTSQYEESQPFPFNAYPTESRMRQKQAEQEAKDKGEIVPKKKKNLPVEDHHDDCGEDIRGLGDVPSDDDEVSGEITNAFTYEGSDSEDETVRRAFYLVQDWHHRDADEGIRNEPTSNLSDLHQAFQTLYSHEAGIDLVEVCGGEGRTGKIAIRRHFSTGENLDLRFGYDLNKPDQQEAVVEYIRRCKPLVLVMAPTCTPYGPWSNLNSIINPETYKASYRDASPHGRFCGRLAQIQIAEGRYYLVEQPHPSYLWEEPE